jgi:hypothetical protein
MDHPVLCGWVALAALPVIVVAVEPVLVGPGDGDAVAHVLAVQVPRGLYCPRMPCRPAVARMAGTIATTAWMFGST